ncbi:MAG: hypothetical protein NTZ60_10260 [Campylobacterales bacterium]|nr:hypothetical protein [Campylobacterales bacterium]
MKKTLMVLVTTAMITSVACAAEVAAQTPPPPPPVAGQQGKGMGQNMSLEEMKTKLNSTIEKRIITLKGVQECANAATTKEQLQACRPKKGAGRQPN